MTKPLTPSALRGGLLTLLLTLALPLLGWGQAVATYPIAALTGTNNNLAATGVNANLTTTPLVKTGVTSTSGSGTYRASGWPTTATVDGGKYIGFTVAPNTGFKQTLTSLSFGTGGSGTGPTTYVWRSSLDGYVGNIAPATLGASFVDLTTPVGFRLYATNAGAATGTGGLSGDLVVNGTVASVAPVAPVVGTTTPATAITAVSATLGGNIATLGSPAPTANGVVYSTTAANAAPALGGPGTTTLAAAVTATATGTYTVGATGLAAGTAYSYQAYVTNANGTAYGGVQTFTTATPTIAVGALTPGGAFGTAEGTASAAQTYALTGTSLGASLTVGPLAGYEFSKTGTAGSYAASLSYAPAAGSVSGTVYVRLAATATAAGSPYNGTIANASTGATTQTVAVSGTVTAAAPALVATPGSLSGLSYTAGAGPSASQGYVLSGSGLTGAGNITVTGSANFEVSLSSGSGFGGSVAVPYAAGVVTGSPTVYVRLKAGLALGSYGPETIGHSGGGVASYAVAVSGSVTAASSGFCGGSQGFGSYSAAVAQGFVFTGISSTDTYATGGAAAPSLRLDASGDRVVTPLVSNPSQLSFFCVAQGTSASSLLVEGYDGAAYTTIASFVVSTIGSVKTYTTGLSAYQSFRFTFTKVSGSNLSLDDVAVQCGTVVPTIVASVSTLALNTTSSGVAGTATSFVVNATGLSANVAVAAPANAQVSLSSSSGFGNSITLPQTGGTVSNKTVYVRLSGAGAVSGTVDLSSAGAAPVSVAVSGSLAVGTVYYYQGGSLTAPGNFNSNPGGGGAVASDFVTPNFEFHIGGTAALDASLTVSGTGAKVVLDPGATLTIPASFTLAARLDMAAGATLVVQSPTQAIAAAAAANTLVPGTWDASSTIDLAQTGTYAVPRYTALVYQNLKLTNGLKIFNGNLAAAPVVNGNLTFDNVQLSGSVVNNSTSASHSGVKLYGDLIQLAGVSYDATKNFHLLMAGTTQTIYGNGNGPIAVYRLGDNGVSTTPPAAASAANTLANAQQMVLANMLYGTATPATTVVQVAHLTTGGVLLANQFSSLTLNDQTTLRFLAGGGGNFFTAHRGRLKLIDGCTVEINRGANGGFDIGSFNVDPNFNTCKDFTLNAIGTTDANRTLTLNSDLNVTGLFALNLGIFKINNNTLNITGDISPIAGGQLQGSASSNLTVGGSGAISGALALDASVANGQTLQNLVLNRAGAAVLTLGSPVLVSNTLDLSAGLVATTAANLLTLGYNAAGGLLNGSAGSYVSGPLARGTTTGAATVLFPIGKDAAYRPLTLNTATQTSLTTYTGEVLTGTARSTAATAPLTRVSAVRYFRLDPAVPPTGYAGTVTLTFGPDDLVNYPADPTFVMAKRPTAAGGPWANIGRTTATSSGAGLYKAGTLESGTITSFSEFSLASTAPASNNAAGTNNPLPVELLNFEAARTPAGPVALRWVTASERNAARFEIERSSDGKAFARIGEVAAQGNKTTLTTYAYLDHSLIHPFTHSPLYYYRLRQLDTDGTAAYSPVRAVDGLGTAPACYPNPAQTVLYAPAAPESRYRVLNLLGQALASGAVPPSGLAEIGIAALLPGTYLLETTTGTGRQLRKFTKE